MKYLRLFVAHGVGLERDRRLHRRQRHKLKNMVRDHVPQARPSRNTAAMLDAEFFGDGDLHVSIKLRFQIGSKMLLPNRKTKIFCTVSLPR